MLRYRNAVSWPRVSTCSSDWKQRDTRTKWHICTCATVYIHIIQPTFLCAHICAYMDRRFALSMWADRYREGKIGRSWSCRVRGNWNEHTVKPNYSWGSITPIFCAMAIVFCERFVDLPERELERTFHSHISPLLSHLQSDGAARVSTFSFFLSSKD